MLQFQFVEISPQPTAPLDRRYRCGRSAIRYVSKMRCVQEPTCRRAGFVEHRPDRGIYILHAYLLGTRLNCKVLYEYKGNEMVTERVRAESY